MSYKRKEVFDHETLVDKELYDNLQDGLDVAVPHTKKTLIDSDGIHGMKYVVPESANAKGVLYYQNALGEWVEIETGTEVGIHGTIVSEHLAYSDVCKWSDGNRYNHDRIGYFVSVDTLAGDSIVIANSTSEVRGVTIERPAFASGVDATKLDESNELTKEYDYVTLCGYTKVIDDGTCVVNARCVPNDEGIATASDNDRGYVVASRIDSTHVLILVEPHNDMHKRELDTLDVVREFGVGFTEEEDTTPDIPRDADTLGGLLPSSYAKQEDIGDTDISEIEDGTITTILKEVYERADVNTITSNFIHAETKESKVIMQSLSGKSVQVGTPTPSAPINPVSVGDDTTLKVTVCGKNLINSIATTTTSNGVTYTVNEDKSITANGTKNNNISFINLVGNISGDYKTTKLIFKKGVSYSIPANLTSGNDITLSFRCTNGSYITGITSPYTPTEDIFVGAIYLQVNVTTTINITVYPQIEVGKKPTEYVWYIESTAEITIPEPLRSINNVRDEIIIVEGKYKIVRRIGKLVLDGVNNVITSKSGTTANNFFFTNAVVNEVVRVTSNDKIGDVMSNIATLNSADYSYSNDGYYVCVRSDGLIGLTLSNSATTVEEANTYLASVNGGNNVIYYAKNTVTYEEIEDQNLFASCKTLEGVSNIINELGSEMSLTYASTEAGVYILNSKETIREYTEKIGDSDISEISNGTVTGAIRDLDSAKIDKANIANNLTTTEEGKVLDARQGKIIYDSLQWKFLGKFIGTSEVSLPSEFNELNIEIYNKGDRYAVHIIKASLTENFKDYIIGYSPQINAVSLCGTYAYFRLTKTVYKMVDSHYLGTLYNDTVESSIWYR